MTVHKEWHNTERLYQIRDRVNRIKPSGGLYENMVLYAVPKIKLHGSCTGVRIDLVNNEPVVSYMSRSEIIRVRGGETKRDLFGFQDFADQVDIETVLASKFKLGNGSTVSEVLANGGGIAIYGEFCGPGIQKKVACSKSEKFWAPFGIYAVDKENHNIDVVIDPADIRTIIGEQPDLIRIVPWFDGDGFESNHMIKPDASGEFHIGGCTYSGMPNIWRIPTFDHEEYRLAKEDIDRLIKQVEDRCPFMLSEFEIDGIGEGMVFYPVHHTSQQIGGSNTETSCFRDKGHIINLVFKAKGEKHDSTGNKPKSEKTPKPLTGKQKIAKEWVDSKMTDRVMETYWKECFGEDDAPAPQKIPDWLKFCGGRIKEIAETDETTKAENLTWKELGKLVTPNAVKYFQLHVNGF